MGYARAAGPIVAQRVSRPRAPGENPLEPVVVAGNSPPAPPRRVDLLQPDSGMIYPLTAVSTTKKYPTDGCDPVHAPLVYP